MPQTNTHDSLLWYGKDIPGLKDLGLVIPNPGGSDHTQNLLVQELVGMTTQYAQRFMLHKDAGRYAYPSITTMVNLHKSLVQAMRHIESRTKTANTIRLEPDHANQQWYAWRLYPVPIYGPQIRNNALRSYATLLLTACTEAMQHSDNQLQQTITPEFANKILPYFREVYTRMAVDYFGKTVKDAQVAGFTLAQTDIDSYDPTKFRADPLEMISVPNDPALQYTENQLQIITRGIDAPDFPILGPWPNAIPGTTGPVTLPQSATTQNQPGGIPNGGGSNVTAPSVTTIPQI